MKIPAASRQSTIIELINSGHGMSIAEMALHCKVSAETIRRDLARLERRGDIQRVYGGAIPPDRSAPVSERNYMIPAGKRAIGQLVAGMVERDQWIFLTGGSTCLAIAEAMPPAAPMATLADKDTRAQSYAPSPVIEGNSDQLDPTEGHTTTWTYATGDIHGQIAILDDRLSRIAGDLRRHPAPTCKIVFTGDYIDRGPDARAVIERLSILCEAGFTGQWSSACAAIMNNG